MCNMWIGNAANSLKRLAGRVTRETSIQRDLGMQVIIVGGGIAGLSAALSLHQIGVPCRIYESVPRLAPIGTRHQPAAQRGA